MRSRNHRATWILFCVAMLVVLQVLQEAFTESRFPTKVLDAAHLTYDRAPNPTSPGMSMTTQSRRMTTSAQVYYNNNSVSIPKRAPSNSSGHVETTTSTEERISNKLQGEDIKGATTSPAHESKRLESVSTQKNASEAPSFNSSGYFNFQQKRPPQENYGHASSRSSTRTCGESHVLWSEEDQSQFNTNRPPHTPGAFMHIGKTGGSTISMQLRNGCHSWVRKPCKNVTQPESAVSMLTTYYHTPDFNNLLRNVARHPYKFYVLSIRDPYERVLSTFTYQHPYNIIARGEQRKAPLRALTDVYKCFPTLETFATLIGSDPLDYEYYPAPKNQVNTTTSCTNMARAVINREVITSDHFYWSIKRVYDLLSQAINNTATIMTTSPVIHVIRTEHLWEDWESSNQCLIGPNNNNTSVASVAAVIDPPKAANIERVRDFSYLRLPVTKTISDTGRRNLCQALVPEYESYLNLLRMASNLEDHEKQDSLELAKRNCPWLDLKL